MLLRGSQFKQQSTYAQAISLAKGAKGNDEEGYRSEFIRLAESAKSMASELASK
jgi:Ca-activated chloride channel family protein